ncbi:hypothetical protein BD779DRAFT_370996 [Infundibulicybe gibba]|nr:hypothetical protein BD779DRAFT_370996 [Infundibulicybe gibba]
MAAINAMISGTIALFLSIGHVWRIHKLWCKGLGSANELGLNHTGFEFFFGLVAFALLPVPAPPPNTSVHCRSCHRPPAIWLSLKKVHMIVMPIKTLIQPTHVCPAS